MLVAAYAAYKVRSLTKEIQESAKNMPPIFGWFDLKGPKFDPVGAAKKLLNAMEGMGTKDEDLIEVLTSHTAEQRVEIGKTYKEKYARDLKESIEGDTSGSFCKTLVALTKDSTDFLLESLVASGSKDTLTTCEILCVADKALLQKLKDTYKKVNEKELEELFGKPGDKGLVDLLIGELNDKRDKFNKEIKVDVAQADADAKALYEAGEKKWGTDEKKFVEIISARTNAQLAALNEAYKKLRNKELDAVITSEIGGALRDALLTIVRCALNPTTFFADRLYNMMSGAGTDDIGLIRVIVSRMEIDLVFIAVEFQVKYKVKLSLSIASETSGYYKDCLNAIVAKLL